MKEFLYEGQLRFVKIKNLYTMGINYTVQKTYFPEIDALRFICAISVVFFHLTYHTGTHRDMFWVGWIGVQVFFIISGFVIAQSVQDTDFKNFLRSRFLRLYPAALICALIGGLSLFNVQNFYLDIELFISIINSILLFSNGPFIGSAYWTIPIEMSFYLLTSIYIIKNGGSLMKLSLLLGLSSSVYVLFYWLNVNGYINADWLEFEYSIANATLLRHGIYFAIGICLFQIYIVNRNGVFRHTLLILACLPAAALEIHARSIEIIQNISLPTLDTKTDWLYPLLILIGSILLIFFSTQKKARKDIKNLRTIRMMGLTTYPLYLIHESIGYNIKWKIESYFELTNSIWAVLFATCCATLIACIIARYLEPGVRIRMRRLWNKLEGPGSDRAQD